MEYTVGDEDIGNDNLGLIDKDATVINDDIGIGAFERLELRAVLQQRAIAHGALHDMVLQDARKLL